ncbi:MAG: hydroxymethylglutaryl-CoA lyase [Bacteroidota bacterium]|nr:hydroxymethylglutaryl-CoA lyase [Bacteroidota bacterium]
MAIVANLRGATEAATFETISLLGYPFSVSETFQIRNTNSGINESFDTVKRIQETTTNSGKELVVYISMAYGNPYGDDWNDEVVLNWISKLKNSGINKIALADTVGLAEAKDVLYLTSAVIREFSEMEVGTHLHCVPGNWREKVEAAYTAGCRHFDAAIKGFGGCPMAKDELVGNLATENLVQYLNEKNVETLINPAEFKHAVHASNLVFLPAL